eukprot:754401-Hanusia_phi.AAC.1
MRAERIDPNAVSFHCLLDAAMFDTLFLLHEPFSLPRSILLLPNFFAAGSDLHIRRSSDPKDASSALEMLSS